MSELTPRQQEQVEALLERLLGTHPDRRAAVLEADCSDPQVRAEVTSLLAARPAAEQLLDTPVVDAAVFAEAVQAAANRSDLLSAGSVPPYPESLGPYRILRKVGEGGMGAVYAAEQTRPFRRQVALKIIKPGMDTRQVLARFEAERQALALMNHPNVAKALDAGETADGRPYFVMEFVEGRRITEYCDQQRLGVKPRLELFIEVCRAIQHAHQKGIIHRDVKPSNVLVARTNGAAEPKVIDFGIAKATRQRLTEETIHTAQGLVIGTPEYMSPEQAASETDIDTRTDVYSLGVLLYELLVGTRPLESDPLTTGGLEQLKRLVREREPLKPSTRLSSLGGAAAELARNRRCETSVLRRLLRGDLDWIVMKCLEKNRERRYTTVAELIDDLERHLRDQPVVAGPPSVVYRARKFARRNRGLVLGTAVVFIVLLAGIVSTAVFAARESEQRKLAQARAETATAVNRFLNNMLSAVDPKQARGRDVGVLRDILDEAASRVQGELSGQPQVESSIRRTIGQTYMNLALYAEAQPHLERALELERAHGEVGNEELATALHLLGLLRDYQGRFEDAEALLSEALDMRREVVGTDSIYVVATLDRLAILMLRLGRFGDAKARLDEAWAVIERTGQEDSLLASSIRNTLASYHSRQGRFAEAEVLFREGLAEFEDRPDDPDRLTKLNNLAQTLKDQGKFDEAERLCREAVERGSRVYGTDHDFTLSARNLLASIMELQQRYAESEALHREVLAARRRVLGQRHPSVHNSLHNLCNVMVAQGHVERGLPVCREAVELAGQIFGPDHFARGISLGLLGFALRESQDPAHYAESEQSILQALSILEPGLPPGHPFVVNTLRGLRKLYGEEAMNDPAKYAEVDRRLEGLGGGKDADGP